MIRPDASEVITRALAEAPTVDDERMAEHVHLLTVTRHIVDAFADEGVDLEELFAKAIAAQTVTIT